jgi:hypothetical protein
MTFKMFIIDHLTLGDHVNFKKRRDSEHRVQINQILFLLFLEMNFLNIISVLSKIVYFLAFQHIYLLFTIILFKIKLPVRIRLE